MPNNLWGFLFKGEFSPTPKTFEVQVKKQPQIKAEDIKTTDEALELNELELGESLTPEVKIRSQLIMVFGIAFVMLIFLSFAAVIVFPLIGKDTPKQVEWLLSASAGGLIGIIVTYFGVKNDTIVSLRESTRDGS